VVAAILSAFPSWAPAQEVVQLGLGNLSAEQHPLADSVIGRDPNHRQRLNSAFIGGLAGAVAIGGLAALSTAGCERDCFGNLAVVLAGAMLGTIAGSAYGASAPEGRGRCTRTQRFGMGIGGAFLGALPSVVFPPIILASAPMGSVMFMRNC
jgi:hypothetical protein